MFETGVIVRWTAGYVLVENHSSTVPGAIGASAAAIAIATTAVPIARRAEITQSAYKVRSLRGKGTEDKGKEQSGLELAALPF